ncbi:MAG: uroporphyrinogen-III C-methyltransferase [Synechococcaceae cyanobacterium SM2_3_60]|nr:uroporphyrinogen-III C-methyltransferase [Synechococcaceae cyanobacterium SM2_3_60]
MALGQVWFVGAGIRDREGLTLAAAAAIDQAEIILVDDLVNPAVWVGSEAEIVPVGKRGGQVSTAQVAINQLLVTYAQQGKRVVRLKAGDPGLFGRLWMEIEALQAENIPFRVVPGLSSALAAPLLAGLCLTEKSRWSSTDRRSSRQVVICSGHEDQPWSVLAALDTLVFLMASRNLPQICASLMTAGKPPATPVWVVKDSGRGRLQGSLAHPPSAQSPCVIVVGDLPHWTPPAQPLAGETVLITRAQVSGLRAQLQQLGAHVLELPTLVITPPTSYVPLDAAIQQLADYDWLVLTSANAVQAFWERLGVAGLDSRALAGMQVAVVGDKTALALQSKGIQADFIPTEFVADALAQELPGIPRRVLFPRVEQGGGMRWCRGCRHGGP